MPQVTELPPVIDEPGMEPVAEPVMEPIIEVKNLCCKSGYRYLLHNINWEVQKGDHWIVFGMNGCGKTTLLRIIAGYNDFTSGSVKVFGESYTDENILNHRKKIGWVSSSFFDKYLSWESALNIVLSGLTGTLSIDFNISDADVKKAKQLLKELRLGDKINQPFCLMSKGERQCVLIARALISSPELLILDEPGTGLDIYAREYVLKTVEDLALNTGMTLIYVTHYAEEILPMFDKTMLMRDGRIYAQGNTEALLNSELFTDYLRYHSDVQKTGDKYDIRLDIEYGLDKSIFMDVEAEELEEGVAE